ncbi:thiamine biosynthesis lipoprotein [Limnobacter thiooxidans]|uniref:FAD:protein FMN transferase n=1 Tax=Limnobacter thiooxidans TaxID=131080 RepID=A0AA86J423_9BURK|nr:thiamine biosynthesis lipoprotein [Limnobacter thiooxidans]BET26844.1 FAD:protein FMN transferase [Limnobacter thiooxidans]
MIRLLIPHKLEPVEPSLLAKLHQVQGHTMGTHWQIRWVHESHLDADTAKIQAMVERVLDRIINQMSTWKEDSLLSQFNCAPAGTVQEIPFDFCTVLKASVALAGLSCGAFNPVAGGLVNLWGFGPGPRYTDPGFLPPGADEISQALRFTDWSALRVENGTCHITQTGGLSLDFSAIAKGYAVDCIAEALLASGLQHVMVEVGGEFRGHGFRPGGLPWWIDLENPPAFNHAQDLVLNRLALHGLAVATSGDYRRHYQYQDQIYSHTIDPRNGRPIEHGLASVSVVHASCMWADGWATALNVLGVHTARELAIQHEIAVRFVERLHDGSLLETITPAFRELTT